MAITAEQRTAVLELYTAYFNRAADTAGVDYWLNEMDTNAWTIENVAQSFADQTEYTATYAGLSNDDTITTIYSNLLGRAATAADLAYWSGELTAGNFTVSEALLAITNAATEIVDGVAVNATDAAVVNNKSTASQYAYDNNNTVTTISLSAITSDTATVTTATTAIAVAIETAEVAAYDAAIVTHTAAVATYDAAVVTAAASAAAAVTAATTVDSVALATASQTAAATAVTDATAVTTAAAAVTAAAAAAETAAAATASIIDDAASALLTATATTNATAATTAATTAAALKTTADTAVTTATDAETAAALVGDTVALTTAATDLIFGTSKSDVYTGTNLTYNVGDIIADSSSIDEDTLTIASTTGANAAAATVIGIENVIFNVTSSDLSAASAALGSISAANITLNQLQAGATATAGVTALTNGSTINFGTGITGATTVTQAVDSSVTVNAGSSSDVTVSTVGAGSATGTTTVNGGATMTDASVTMATTGTATIVGTTGLVNATTVAKTANITTTADAATGIDISGTGTADTATISIGSAATITASNAVETINVSTSATATTAGVTQTSVATLDTTGATNAATTYNLTGTNSIVLAGNEASFDGKTLTDNTTAGTTTVRITTSNDSDLSKVAADIIDLAADANGHTYTVANNQTVLITSAPGGDVTLDINDQTSAYTDGAVTVNLGVAMLTTKGVIVAANSATSDNITTLNVINDTAAGVLDLQATATADVVLTGSKNLSLDAATSTAKTLDASAFTGNLTMTATDLKIFDVTSGTGNDSITATTADTLTLDGGAGTDTLTAGVNMTTSTFTNFEVLTLTGNATNTQFKASQLTGSTMAVKDSDAGADEKLAFDTTVASSIDTATMDFSGLIFDNAGTDVVIEVAAGSIASTLGLGSSFNITGSVNIDDITLTDTTSANTVSTLAGADIVLGGSGVDTVTLGEGVDTVTGGLGADIIDLTEATAAIDTVILSTGGAIAVDEITGFNVATAANDGDNVDIDLSDINGLVGDLSLAGDLSTASNVAADTDPVIAQVAVGAYDMATDATAHILNIVGDYATTSALETALEVGGTSALTTNSTGAEFAANDAFLILHDDGTDSYLSYVVSAAGAADDATFASGDLTITNIAKFVGISDSATFVSNNFDIIA